MSSKVLAVDVVLTLTFKNSLSAQAVTSAYTTIHAPEYPEPMSEQAGFDRAQELIRHVESLVAMRRAA